MVKFSLHNLEKPGCFWLELVQWKSGIKEPPENYAVYFFSPALRQSLSGIHGSRSFPDPASTILGSLGEEENVTILPGA